MRLYRIHLDPLRRETVKAFHNPALFHSTIENARPGERTRILWRTDQLKGEEYLLVLADENFNPESVSELYGYPEESPESRDYQSLLDRIREGSVCHFRLSANPVFSSRNGLERGKLKAHVSVEHQMDWLRKQADKHGFRIDEESTRLVQSKWIHAKKNQSTTVNFKKAVFEGKLTVVNVEKFKNALVSGIGREKAYGAGLLTVVPLYE